MCACECDAQKSVTQVIRCFLGETKFDRWPNPLSGISFQVISFNKLRNIHGFPIC